MYVIHVLQVAAMSVGLNNILQVSQGVWSSHGMGVACVRGVGGAATGTIGTSARKWRVGELEFEALMRMLDNKVMQEFSDMYTLTYSCACMTKFGVITYFCVLSIGL